MKQPSYTKVTLNRLDHTTQLKKKEYWIYDEWHYLLYKMLFEKKVNHTSACRIIIERDNR